MNLNRIDIVFDEEVAVSMPDLQVVGVNIPHYEISDFVYDVSQRTATWTLGQFLTLDRLLLVFKEQVIRHLEVVPGDIDRDGVPTIFDFVPLKGQLGQTASSDAYSVFSDIDGDGSVSIADVEGVRSSLGTQLPDSEPDFVRGQVTWMYQVSNTCQMPFDHSEVTVADDQLETPPTFVAASDDGDGILSPGETWLYAASSTVADLAKAPTTVLLVTGCNRQRSSVTRLAYENVGRVTAGEATDTDLSHYCNPLVPRIGIETSAERGDSAQPPGPIILSDSMVDFTYRVRNLGSEPLRNLRLRDNNGTGIRSDDFEPTFVDGDANHNGALEPGELWIYTATQPAKVGQHVSISTVTGRDAEGRPVTDTDSTYYFGALPEIDIEKSTNGADADSPTGPVVPVGSEVEYTYLVTNRGNVPLENVAVRDDNGTSGSSDNFTPNLVGGDTNNNLMLDVGKVWSYGATRLARIGQKRTTTIVTADDPTPRAGDVTDADVSHYFGFVAGIDIEKATHGQDADIPPGPNLQRGDLVEWTYTVSNTGNIALADLIVRDDAGTPSNPRDDFSPMPVTLGGFNVGDLDQDALLDTDESWAFSFEDTASVSRPDTFSDFVQVVYNHASELLIATGNAGTFYLSTTNPPANLIVDGVLRIQATIDATGMASTGTLEVRGTIDTLQATSGVLLTAVLTDLDAPLDEQGFFFLNFDVTGGDLREIYEPALLVIMDLNPIGSASDFKGSFETSFFNSGLGVADVLGPPVAIRSEASAKGTPVDSDLNRVGDEVEDMDVSHYLGFPLQSAARSAAASSVASGSSGAESPFGSTLAQLGTSVQRKTIWQSIRTAPPRWLARSTLLFEPVDVLAAGLEPGEDGSPTPDGALLDIFDLL